MATLLFTVTNTAPLTPSINTYPEIGVTKISCSIMWPPKRISERIPRKRKEEVLEEFRKRLCTDYYNDRFSIWNTFAESGTIKVFVEPLITLEIPTTRANAAKFVKDYETYHSDRYKFDTKIERAVRDDGEVYVTYLRIASPSGAVLEYFGE